MMSRITWVVCEAKIDTKSSKIASKPMPQTGSSYLRWGRVLGLAESAGDQQHA